MKVHYLFHWLLFLLCLLFLLSSCQKEKEIETAITGKVTDKFTGLPIHGASIDFTGYKNNDNGTITAVEFGTVYTNGQGDYSILLVANGLDGVVVKFPIKLPKYPVKPTTQFDFEPGNSTVQDFALSPIDAVLRFEVEHESAQQADLFLQYFSPELFGGCRIEPFPVSIPSGQNFTFETNVPGGGQFTIYWWLNDLTPHQSIIMLDSVFVDHLDTVVYRVSY